jgi:hypothetical protein
VADIVGSRSADDEAAKLKASAQLQSSDAERKMSELQHQKWSEQVADVRPRIGRVRDLEFLTKDAGDGSMRKGRSGRSRKS